MQTRSDFITARVGPLGRNSWWAWIVILSPTPSFNELISSIILSLRSDWD